MDKRKVHPSESPYGVQHGDGGHRLSALATGEIASDERGAAGRARVIPMPSPPVLRASVSDFMMAACISDMPIFSDLTPEEISSLDVRIVVKHVCKGKVIYRPGESGEVLFLLKKGSMHQYLLSPEGRKLIIQTINPMTFFGEMPMLGQSMWQLFAEAAEDSLICVMKNADVKRLIRLKPQIGLRMLEEVGRRLYDARERLGDMAFRKIRERVARLLLNLSGKGTRPIKGISQQEIADMLGVYRETVSNTLAELRDEGVIDLARKQITILDPVHLHCAAKELTSPREQPRATSAASR